LTAAVLSELFDKLLDQARNSSGHVQRQAIELLLRLATLAPVEGEQDDPEAVDLDDMTPAQRAALRARIERRPLELEGELGTEDEGEEHPEAPQA
jgi:hypothetical protein